MIGLNIYMADEMRLDVVNSKLSPILHGNDWESTQNIKVGWIESNYFFSGNVGRGGRGIVGSRCTLISRALLRKHFVRGSDDIAISHILQNTSVIFHWIHMISAILRNRTQVIFNFKGERSKSLSCSDCFQVLEAGLKNMVIRISVHCWTGLFEI